MKKFASLPFAFFLFGCFSMVKSFGQCAAPISTFPYFENFELSNGGWTTGGANSDWTYGTPNKAVITTALSSKCWISGGLTGNLYNSNELAWVQSPCFNFSANPYPYIKFKVFWETEKKFDGALLQYSINSGATWSTVGSIADPVNCLNGNWYNYSPVKYLTPPAAGTNGWSGSVASPPGCPSTSGSGAWVTAQHTMPYLAGQPKVIFRFLFGAGTTCNNFNGFAFDDVLIDIAPSNNAGFTYSCTGASTVSFTNTSTLCPTLAWSFGDPASGAVNNASALATPSHTFSGPGTYTVTLTATGPDNAPSAVSQTITILGLTPSIASPITCNGSTNGSVTVAVAGGAGPFGYSWNSLPIQNTQTATGLGAGTYTVTVTGANTCASNATITLTAPPALSFTATPTAANCGAANGSVTITGVAGGTAPYTYSFNGSPYTATTVYTIGAGTYPVSVKDANGCVSATSVTVTNIPGPTALAVTATNSTCGNPNGTVTIGAVTGGTAPYTFSFNGSTYTATTVYTIAAGTYPVSVKDANGCIFNTSVTVAASPGPTALAVTATNSTCGNPNGTVTIGAVTGGTAPYSYSFNGSAYTATTVYTTAAGTYPVSVKDANGCIFNITVTVSNSAGPTAVAVTATNATCTNPDGSVTIGAVTGGTAPYTYSFNGSLYTATTVYTISAGTYPVSVKDANGCIFNTSVRINSTSPPPPVVSPVIYCRSAPAVPLTAAGVNLLWYTTPTGGTGSSAAPIPSTAIVKDSVYYVSQTVNGCESPRAGLIVKVILSNVQAFAGNDTIAVRNLSHQLHGSGGINYIWSSPTATINNPNSQDPTVILSTDANIYLKVTDAVGCVGYDSLFIKVYDGPTYWVPSAFSPNGDGLNDIFRVIPSGIATTIYLRVFNRYGELVFETNQWLKGWNGTYNGKPQPNGAYVWTVSGIDRDNKRVIMKGTVILIR